MSVNLSVGSASFKATGDLRSRGCKVGRKFSRSQMIILEFTASFVTSLGGDRSPELQFEHGKTRTVPKLEVYAVVVGILASG